MTPKFAHLALLTLPLSSVLGAQSMAVPKTPPPPLGPIVLYSYWPTQYIQFVTGPELPYSMFLLEVDNSGKQPLYHAILTGKDGTRTHYSNTAQLAARYKAQGDASYQVAFAVELDDSDKVGATSTARFTTHDEKPLEFRFVQGSDISGQGSGLQPVPDAPVPVFAYRELGAVAGEGTALKIGDAVSTAEVWKGISHPPYFVGYRGAETSSAHQLVFAKTTQTWMVASFPAALTAGNTWELDSDKGDHLSLHIDGGDAAHLTITATERFQPAVRMVMEATRTAPTPATAASPDVAGQWSTERVSYMPAIKGGEKHSATLTFTPALGDAASSTMELSIAKKKNIATATLTGSGAAADRTTQVVFTAPAWVTSKTLTEETKQDGATLVRSAQ